MKKTLALALSGSLLIGSSVYIFANEGVHLVNKEANIPQEQQKLETEIQDKAPTITIEVLDGLLEGTIDHIELDTEITIEEQLLALLRKIGIELEDLHAEMVEELSRIITSNQDLSQEEMEEIQEIIGELEEIAAELQAEIDEEEVLEETEENDPLFLEKLYAKLAKFQAVYDRVPLSAKPAIEKNIKKIQLRIVQKSLIDNQSLETLLLKGSLLSWKTGENTFSMDLKGTDLVEEAEILEIEVEIQPKPETKKQAVQELLYFIQNNPNWHKELKREIHAEFKAQKKEVKLQRQEEKKASKEIKKEGVKDKVNIPTKEATFKNTSKEQSPQPISHPVKETHPGKGKGLRK